MHSIARRLWIRSRFRSATAILCSWPHLSIELNAHLPFTITLVEEQIFNADAVISEESPSSPITSQTGGQGPVLQARQSLWPVCPMPFKRGIRPKEYPGFRKGSVAHSTESVRSRRTPHPLEVLDVQWGASP